jgi:hypothetical protein
MKLQIARWASLLLIVVVEAAADTKFDDFRSLSLERTACYGEMSRTEIHLVINHDGLAVTRTRIGIEGLYPARSSRSYHRATAGSRRCRSVLGRS